MVLGLSGEGFRVLGFGGSGVPGVSGCRVFCFRVLRLAVVEVTRILLLS